MATHPISIDSAGGEYMEDVVVVGWAVQPGDRVKSGELVVTVETAKAATEIEADRDGWLSEIFFAEGQEAPVGAVLGTIADEKPEPAEATDADSPVTPPTDVRPEQAAVEEMPTVARQSGGRVVASPLARRLAGAAGLDLSGIAGSGPKSRIKKRDVDAALAARSDRHEASAASRSAPAVSPGKPTRRMAPVVLIHGFGAERSIWRQVVPLLGPEIESIGLDLPGHGVEAARTATSIEEVALLLSDRLDEMGVAEAHLVGHSLGGAAALALSGLGRCAFRSITLLAPAGLGPEINGGFMAGITRAATAQALERWLTTMVGDMAALPPGYAQAALRQMQRIGNAEAMAALADNLFPNGSQGFALAPALAALTVPTRIIWGKLDRIIPVAHAGRVPGSAAVHLLDGIGHVPQLEAPPLTARLITETVRSAG